MTILAINSVVNEGSTGKIVFEIHRKLIENGNISIVIYGRNNKKLKDDSILCCTNLFSNYLDALLTRIFGFVGHNSILSTLLIINKIKLIKPDIVHLHNLHGYYLNIPILLKWLAKNRKIYTMITMHDEFLFTGKCGYAYDCDRWETTCDSCPQLKKYPKVLFFDNTKYLHKEKMEIFNKFNNLDLVVPSKWLRERVMKSFLSKFPIHVIHNGIDCVQPPLDEIKNLKKNLNLNNKKIVLSVAPNILDERKGGKYLIDLAKRNFDSDVFFLLVGAKKEDCFSTSNLLILPPVKDQRILFSYYAMSSVFVLCSRRETFSMTCAEALCCGTPIVGFKSGAPETVFIEPYANFVNYGDIDTLEEKIKNILNIGYEREPIKEYGINNFSNHHMYNDYEKLYRAMCKK